ncbi:MAG: hypothetical protein FJX25_14055 [Alphaproteobacteria bacterium]|nr:hypothetical protein [Alphaproteobacteria bacterium]
MRGWMVIAVLALAGCGEHRGWNPNYQFGATAYGRYLVEREASLVTGSAARQGIPVARPVMAPTAAEIAGHEPVTPPATMGLKRVVRGGTAVPPPAPRPAPAQPVAVAPATTMP